MNCKTCFLIFSLTLDINSRLLSPFRCPGALMLAVDSFLENDYIPSISKKKNISLEDLIYRIVQNRLTSQETRKYIAYKILILIKIKRVVRS